jgi:hypothetical protein
MSRKFVIVLAIGVIIVFLLYNSNVFFSREKAYISISPRDSYRLMEDENVFVIDVHVPEQKHLPRTDAWIPYEQN